jgi:hypothetical protein
MLFSRQSQGRTGTNITFNCLKDKQGVLSTKCVFQFSLQILLETFFLLMYIERLTIEGFMCSVRYCGLILIKNGTSRKFLVKLPNVNFIKEVKLFGQTDGQTDGHC